MNLVVIELGAALFAVLFSAAFYWLHDSGRFGIQALRRFNLEAREHWVRAVLNKPGSEILVVQTLRNSIMAATVMGSTSILLLMAAMTLIADPEKYLAHLRGTEVMAAAPWLWTVKAASLLLTLFAAFWHYSQSVRAFNHVGYLLGTPGQATDEATAMRITRMLNTAGKLYSSGNRYFYFTVPLAFWWFGPLYLLGVAALLLSVTYWAEQRVMK